jgi:hypothetical protein
LPPAVETHHDLYGLTEAQPVPQSQDVDIDFRDFGRVLGWNFTRGLFSPENIGPLVIGSGATTAALPLAERQLAVYPIVGRGKRGAVVVWQF